MLEKGRCWNVENDLLFFDYLIYIYIFNILYMLYIYIYIFTYTYYIYIIYIKYITYTIYIVIYLHISIIYNIFIYLHIYVYIYIYIYILLLIKCISWFIYKKIYICIYIYIYIYAIYMYIYICNHQSCCGDNWEGTFFSWLHIYYAHLAYVRFKHYVCRESLMTSYVMLLTCWALLGSLVPAMWCVTVHHVPNCRSCIKATVMITRRAHIHIKECLILTYKRMLDYLS